MNTTTNTETTDPRIHALAKHLQCDASDISKASYGDNVYEAEGDEYLVLTEDEANELAAERIKESLWAFNAEFISSHTKHGLDDDQIEALKQMQGKLCENANSIVEALIEDLDHFIEDAIRSDGRGHFISSYDGEEYEVGEKIIEFYIYQTN
jgi:hypothetical protein